MCHIHTSQHSVHLRGTLLHLCSETCPTQMLSLPGSPCCLSPPCSFHMLLALIFWYWALLILYYNGRELGQGWPPDCDFIHAKKCAQLPLIVLQFYRKLLEAKKGPNITLLKPIANWTCLERTVNLCVCSMWVLSPMALLWGQAPNLGERQLFCDALFPFPVTGALVILPPAPT